MEYGLPSVQFVHNQAEKDCWPFWSSSSRWCPAHVMLRMIKKITYEYWWTAWVGFCECHLAAAVTACWNLLFFFVSVSACYPASSSLLLLCCSSVANLFDALSKAFWSHIAFVIASSQPHWMPQVERPDNNSNAFANIPVRYLLCWCWILPTRQVTVYKPYSSHKIVK